MALPLKTTADDVRSIVKYLSTKPTGATLVEAKAVDQRMVDHRKLAAFVAWGLIAREDGRLKLVDRGWTAARHPEREQEVFREVVGAMTPYTSAIDWAHHQEMDALTTNDVAVHWHEHHRDAVGDANENTLRENAVTFFHVAMAAGLGTLVKGRGGKPTRLELQRVAIKEFVEAGPATPPWTATRDADEAEAEVEAAEAEAERQEPTSEEPPAKVEAPRAPEQLRVFISHGKNRDIVEQIEVMLGLADIQPEVAVDEETTAIPVPEKVLNSMRRCQAGIIAVTVDESRKDEDGNYTLNENVLIEIGAAFVLYDQRVVLVWDKRLPVPSNLQGLYRCEFEGDELSWSAGMKLMKAIQDFKKAES
ncbi:MAG: TIR domain-containing protein [Solirubrobacteraceae bacterium]